VPGTREWRQLLDRVLAGTAFWLVALVWCFSSPGTGTNARFGKFALGFASVLKRICRHGPCLAPTGQSAAYGRARCCVARARLPGVDRQT